MRADGTQITEKMLLRMMAAAGGESPVTYVLVVDDPPILTGGTVGAHVLLDAPVTAPPAQNTATASARAEAERKK